jgi:tetratricopeptide (TPR) repeat protein
MNAPSALARAARTRFVVGAVVVAVGCFARRGAAQESVDALVIAEEGDVPTRAAAKHFQRAVDFYTASDYRAALIEFNRAYALVPKADVLYNLGETQYELQDYAGALIAFERYLAETIESNPHHKEVARQIDVLRKLVGHVTIATSTAGADVEIDDRFVGRTPIDAPILVSAGRRKVAASLAGGAPIVAYVDVSAGDVKALSLQLAGPGPSPATAPWAWDSVPQSQKASARGGGTLRALGWIGTAALAVGAGAFGVVALQQWGVLQRTGAAGAASGKTLADEANRMLTYSAIAEGLGAAAAVVGSVTLYATLSLQSAPLTTEKSASSRLVPGGVMGHLEATF